MFVMVPFATVNEEPILS